MTVTSPETEMRDRIINVLNTEFTSEGIVFSSDRLHPSLGQGKAVGAVYPGPSKENPRQVQVLNLTCYVQLFGAWTPEVNPAQVVDPDAIENWAERIRRACNADTAAGDAHVWYYRVVSIEYPPDPTENCSRLVATVTAEAQNPAVITTSG